MNREDLMVPWTRTRINHTYSKTSGWRCNDTTVELYAPDLDTFDYYRRLDELQVEADNRGRIEAQRRNKIEASLEDQAA